MVLTMNKFMSNNSKKETKMSQWKDRSHVHCVHPMYIHVWTGLMHNSGGVHTQSPLSVSSNQTL